MKNVVSEPASPSAVPVDGRTRDRVGRLLLELGPSTAAALGQRLGLSPAAVRRHLDAMLADGTILARETRSYGSRGRGRPARTFALSETGRAAFPHAYDDLAVHALRFLRRCGGDAAVTEFARSRVSALESRYRAAVAAAPSQDDRAEALARALTSDGYAASAQPRPGGTQLCQHHCPVHQVAAEFPQLCEAETAFFGSLLGTHVQRLATIAHGDGVCTTYVPRRGTAPGPDQAPDRFASDRFAPVRPSPDRPSPVRPRRTSS